MLVLRYLWAVLLWSARALQLAAFFLWELLLANLRVALDVLTPRQRMRPAIIAIPLSAKSDLGITLFANLITLTPGTLSLDVSDDRDMLYIHAMYVENIERTRTQLKRTLERRVVELFS